MKQFRFHNVEDYIRFCAEHRDDGYIVIRSNAWTLHHANCWYITHPIEIGQDVMSYEK